MSVPPRGMIGGVDGVQRLLEHAVVERQRALQERVAREGHQPDPIALELRHQVANGQLGARQAVRLQIRRQHALRGVEREQQVDAAAVGLLPANAPLGARQRHAAETVRRVTRSARLKARRVRDSVEDGPCRRELKRGQREPALAVEPRAEQQDDRGERAGRRAARWDGRR